MNILLKSFALGTISLTLLNLLTTNVYAVAGQWSSSSSTIFYQDGLLRLGKGNSAGTTNIRLQVTNGYLAIDNGDNASSIVGADGNLVLRTDRDGDGTGNYTAFQDFTGQFLMKIQDDGNVGIGVDFPKTKLQVRGNMHGGQIQFQQDVAKPIMGLRAYNDGAKDMMMFYTQVGYSAVSKYPMVITNEQRVGIGTTNPTKTLSVNGTILAREIIVSNAASNWPDYVFEDGYDLMSLEEVEAFIEVNKHLPNIPSQNDIEKEGISLGQMQKLQMEKIEELTLHLIEKEKDINGLKEENTELLGRIERLESILFNN